LYVKQDAVEPPALPAQLQLRVFGLLTVELYVPAEQAAPADGNESETVPLALPQTPLIGTVYHADPTTLYDHAPFEYTP
jgi:hypothetical protein